MDNGVADKESEMGACEYTIVAERASTEIKEAARLAARKASDCERMSFFTNVGLFVTLCFDEAVIGRVATPQAVN